MTKLFFALLVIAGFASESHASRYVGNGGFAVRCAKPDGKTTLELLDLWEARRLDPTYRVGSSSIEEILAHLATAAPKLATFLAEEYPVLSSEATFTYDYSLFDSGDVGELAVPLPIHCRLQQIADHVFVPFGRTGRMTIIDEAAYRELSEEDRRGLLLHELLYGAFEGAIGSSREVRDFTSFLADDRLRSRTREEIARAMRASEFEDLAPMR